MAMKNNPPTWVCEKCKAENTQWGFPKDWARISIHNLGSRVDKKNPGYTYIENPEKDLCSKCSEFLPSLE